MIYMMMMVGSNLRSTFLTSLLSSSSFSLVLKLRISSGASLRLRTECSCARVVEPPFSAPSSDGTVSMRPLAPASFSKYSLQYASLPGAWSF